MLARKPRMLVIVALANKMAPIVWALLMKRESYRAPTAVTALQVRKKPVTNNAEGVIGGLARP
jgi:hypothetical protein